MYYLKRIVLIGIIFLGTLLWGAPKAMIIFDASGSMWGQIDGVNKIVIARDALRSVVRQWNPAVELGLTVYGHRVKGDCNDIETVIPIGPVNKKRMIDTVMGISPKGKTPIAKSLRRVARQLRGNEDPTTIILISDGRESCGADPCATARRLKAEGINFVAHVVGFNVDAKTDRQLACIAHATGGEYFSAKNAAALNNAIRVIAKKVEKPKPKPKPKITRTVLELKARYTMNPQTPIDGVHWKITQNGKPLFDKVARDPAVPAAVGAIHVEARLQSAPRPQRVAGDLTLKAQKNNPVTVRFKSGRLRIDTAEETGGPRVSTLVRIYPLVEGGKSPGRQIDHCTPGKTEPCTLVLPVGDYLATAEYEGMKAQARFALKNREEKELHLTFRQTGQVAVSASEAKDGPWIVAHIGNIYNAQGERVDYGFNTEKKKPRLIRLPIGKYTLEISYNHFKKKVPFTIEAGKTTPLHILMGSTGTVAISASETEGGQPIKAHIGNIYDARGERVDYGYWTYPKKPKLLQLPAGKYTVDMDYNLFKKKGIPFEIKPGETTRLHVVMGQTGQVAISASEAEGGKWIRAHIDEIRNADDERVKVGYWTDPKKPKTFTLPVGKYTLRMSHNRYKKEGIPFEIKPGETTKVHVVMGQTGTVAISAGTSEGGKWIRAHIDEIRDADGERVKVGYWTDPKKPKTFRLPTGEYFLDMSYKDFKRKNIPFRIEAGKSTKVHILFAPRHISVRGLPPCTRVHFELIAPDGRLLAESDAPAYKGADFLLGGERAFVEASAGDLKKRIEIQAARDGIPVVDFGGSEDSEGISGVWKTTEGITDIRQHGKKVRGSYPQDNGVIVGEMTYPRRLVGYWIEDHTNRECSTPKEGRTHWGRFVWNFDGKRCRFTGKWSYCDDTPNHRWNGEFLRPLPPREDHTDLIRTDRTAASAPVQKETSQPRKAPDPAQKALERLDRAVETTQQARTPEAQARELGRVMEALGGLMQSVQPARQAAPKTITPPANSEEDDLKLLNE